MLQDLITTTDEIITEELMNKWDSLTPLLRNEYVLKEVEVPGALSYKYRYDYDGLLIENGISSEYHYPHYIANSMKSSINYRGGQTTIKILDTNKLSRYLELFQNN